MTTGYTKITEENAKQIPIGSRLVFNYGPMCGSEEGTVTGYQVTRWGCQLTAETDAGEQKFISGLSSYGIGVYLN